MQNAHAYDVFKFSTTNGLLAENHPCTPCRVSIGFSTRPIAWNSSPLRGLTPRNARGLHIEHEVDSGSRYRPRSCLIVNPTVCSNSTFTWKSKDFTTENYCEHCIRLYRNLADVFHVTRRALCSNTTLVRPKAKSLTNQPSSPRTRVGVRVAVRLRSRNTTLSETVLTLDLGSAVLRA